MLPLRLRHFTLAALLAASAACRTPAPGALADPDRTAIAETSKRWNQGMSARDLDAVAACYTEDAALLPPGGEAVRGKAGIRAFFTAFPPVRDLVLEHIEVDGRGDLAYVWGRYSMKITPPGAAAFEDRGKYLEVWRRQPDGSWRIARDMFSSDLGGH